MKLVEEGVTASEAACGRRVLILLRLVTALFLRYSQPFTKSILSIAPSLLRENKMAENNLE